MTTNENPNALSDHDRFDTYLRAVWDQFSAALDHRYGRLPEAESTARKLAVLGLPADVERIRAILDARRARVEEELAYITPEYVEARLAELKARMATNPDD